MSKSDAVTGTKKKKRIGWFASFLYFAASLFFFRPSLCLPLWYVEIPRSVFPMPPFMVRGGVERSETEGIRKSAFDKVNRNAGNQSAKRASLVMHFLPL